MNLGPSLETGNLEQLAAIMRERQAELRRELQVDRLSGAQPPKARLMRGGLLILAAAPVVLWLMRLA